MKLLLLLLALPMIGFGQNVNIPDANFKAYLVGNTAINTNGDNQIQVSEASVFNGSIILWTFEFPSGSGLNITDLTGIEAFVSLTILDCSWNQLTSLDLSGCTALTSLDCNNNQLTSIDVSSCSALTILGCSWNQLTSLDVSGCTALNGLDCYNNQITSLDVSPCTALTTLECSENYSLTSIDVSSCTALTILGCSWNQLTSLDVSACTALTYLYCSWNQLTSLDVSSCTALTYLGCCDNQLTSLDLSTCTAITYLVCSNNNLTSLDVSTCTAITELYCYSNQLTSLDVSSCTALTFFNCDTNQLTSLDVSTCSAITGLDCSYNQLTSLDVKNGNNINMYIFYAYNNPNLSCIEVDNVAWSNTNWQDIDAASSFSLNCSGAGISDINESKTLMLYPNPTNGDFTITGLELLGTVSSLTLNDMNGKVVKVLDTKATKFSMSSIKPGVYFLNILSENKQELLKIVKE